MNEISISAVVITRPGSELLPRCLASLGWCDAIILVVDTARKFEIRNLKLEIKGNGLKIFDRKLTDNFAEQRNFGLEKATGEWVLFLDSDEEVSEQLAAEIKSRIKQKDEVQGFYIGRRDYFLGKWLEFGETSKVQLMRLAKKSAGLWQGKVHELWSVEGSVIRLKNPILHYPHSDIASFLKDINRYTDLVAQSWKEEGRKMGVWEILVYPSVKFVQNYILRLGFLDGVPGLIVALMMSFHSFLARAKYWRLTR